MVQQHLSSSFASSFLKRKKETKMCLNILILFLSLLLNQVSCTLSSSSAALSPSPSVPSNPLEVTLEEEASKTRIKRNAQRGSSSGPSVINTSNHPFTYPTVYAQPAFRSISHSSSNGLQPNIHATNLNINPVNNHNNVPAPYSSHNPMAATINSNQGINFHGASSQLVNARSSVFESSGHHLSSVPTGCPHPPVPLYAQVMLSDEGTIRSGSTASYKCDDGYELFGSPLRTCGHNGKWSDDVPYCAVNVAYGKPTNQSSTIRGGDSRNANDGDVTTVHENKFCTETKVEQSPWWMVDLLQPYEVKVIRLLTRGCCGHSQLHDLEIRVGNSSVPSGNKLCAWFPGTLDDGTSKDLPCASAIKGRFVFIQMVGIEASLSLCEVFVFTTKEFSSDRCGSSIMDHQSLISFNQTCYEFQTNVGGSYNDATNYCKARGGLIVNNVDNVTHNFLFYELERLKSKLKSRLIWLGAKRETSLTNAPSFHRSRSNTWKWVNGDSINTFLWAEDQPNNYNGQQNCIVLDGGRKWLWNDVTCDLDYLPWICQYNPSNCGSPDKQELSIIIDKDYRVGKEIRYECPIGFKLEGVDTRKCLPDGFWSSTSPSCKYVTCGSLPDISRGRVLFIDKDSLGNGRTNFNATAKYSCDKDYTLVGNETRTCLGNGSWSGLPPKCLYSWCPELSFISNGILNVTNRTEHGLASYTCARGHKLFGNGTRVCTLGGKWTGEEPACKFIDCGIPLDIKHGRYQLLNATTSYQSMIRYDCDENYTLIGSEFRNCTEFATWNGLEPSCKLIDCGRPEVPSSAELITSNANSASNDVFTVGSEIKLKCKPGHKFTGGSETRKCNKDAKWDGQTIECKFIDCGRVPVIFKGEVKYVNSTTHLDSIVNYTCSYGYQVVGSKTRQCKDDGKWTETSPKCEEIRCVPPQVPKNSSVVYSGNDRSTADSFKVGSTVQYKCATGHTVRGQSLRTCELDGSWSGSPPDCVYVDCGWPYVIPQGRWLLTTNSTHYGSTVEYECINNYRIDGPPRRLCQENGTWSHNAPSCVLINCGSPPIKDDKTITEGSVWTIGSKISYSCQYGYELVGEEIKSCDKNGKWVDDDSDIPFCRLIDCGRPQVLPNGRGYLLNSSTTYDSIIEYHCMPDFKIIGDPVRRCLATGQWSGSLPRCLELSLITEMTDNDLDSRADKSGNHHLISGVNGHGHGESSKAIGIGIAVGIGALLVLVLTIAVVCLKTKKPAPVKAPENIEVRPPGSFDGHHHHGNGHHHNGIGTRIATVNGHHHNKPPSELPMSYSRLSLQSAADNVNNQQPIRHHPNGLVTFCPNNGAVHVNGNAANGSVHAHSNGHAANGHVVPNNNQSNGHVVTGHGGGGGAVNGGHRVNGGVHRSQPVNKDHHGHRGHDGQNNVVNDAPQHNINHHVHQLKSNGTNGGSNVNNGQRNGNDPNQVIVIV